MAIMFDVDQLVEMMSIGTLLAYTIVALCVLILRYQEDENAKIASIEHKASKRKTHGSLFDFFRQLLNLNGIKHPNSTSSAIANWSVVVFTCLSILVCAYSLYGAEFILDAEPYGLAGLVVIIAALILTIIVIARQPVTDIELSFKVPWVPLVPCLSIIINILLMLKLEVQTWVRFVVWLAIGFLIYFLYGIRHSEENIKSKMQGTEKRCSTSISNAATASLRSEKVCIPPAEKIGTYKEVTQF